MARPAHRPDAAQRRQVEAMAGYGVPEPDIARVLHIDPKTLRKHYREELDNGHVKANADFDAGDNYYDYLPPVINFIAPVEGWYHVVVRTPNAETNGVNFVLRYGRYAASNPNCANPTSPIY